MNNITKQLFDEGFYKFSNVISNEDLLEMEKGIIENKINYLKLKKFIDRSIIKNVNDKLNLNLINIKYRGSNNNNSADASNYHRDLIIQDLNIKNQNKIFTIVTYLDKSIMEVIPKSHLKNKFNYNEILQLYNKKKQIIMNPGDILIFNATLVHKGIFYFKTDNRRIIQLFDCVDINDYDFAKKYILHTPCLGNCSKTIRWNFINISKIKILNKLIDMITLLNTLRGYGIEFQILKRLSLNNYKFLSTEGNQQRLQPKFDNTFEEGNLYIMNYKTNDNENNHRNIIYLYIFINNFIYILCLCFIIIGLYKLFSN